MRKTAAMVAVVLLVNASAAFAQAPTKERYSDGLAIAGLATMLVGAVLMVPTDDPTSTTYTFDAGSYCAASGANNNVTVSKGGCNDLPAMRVTGLVTMGVGAVLTLIGLHRVDISPQVGRKTIGARVSVKW